ncbi:MAG: hypothetical protein ACYTEO_13405, partial [Planctomycetota bacterium]
MTLSNRRFVFPPNNIDDLADVDTTTSAPAANEVLVWDGTNWVPGSVAAAKITGQVAIANGGTAASTAAAARTNLGLVIGTNVQAYDAGLSSLAGLAYVSDSFIKITAGDTYAVRTISETKQDLSLDNVENTALSTWAGSGNITTVGTLVSGAIGAGFTEIATAYTAAKCTDATADNTASNETSHADVVVDGDIGSSVQAYGNVLDDLNTLGANSADSEFLVGTGAGALAWESGATVRSSLGLGTSDSPTFDDITVSTPSNIYALSHDSFAGFVANEHKDTTAW